MNDNVIALRLGSNSPRPPRDERDWLTGPELCQETGITYRQLDYWTRTNLLTPNTVHDPGSGHLRAFPESQADRARAIHELLHAGMSLQTIRQVVDAFLTHGHVQIGTITITHTPAGAAS